MAPNTYLAKLSNGETPCFYATDHKNAVAVAKQHVVYLNRISRQHDFNPVVLKVESVKQVALKYWQMENLSNGFSMNDHYVEEGVYEHLGRRYNANGKACCVVCQTKLLTL